MQAKKGECLKKRRTGGQGQELAIEAAGADKDCAEEDAQVGGQAKPNKKKGRCNPFSIPPSSCDALIFSIQQPFVDVVFSMQVETMPGDKVLDGETMDADALKTAIRELSLHYLAASKPCKAPSSELGCRDLHAALAKSFWWLTRPRKKATLSVGAIQDLLRSRDQERVQGPDEHTDLEVEVTSACSEADDRPSDDTVDRPSNDSVDVRFAGDEGECSTKTSQPRKYDIKFMVYDERIKGIDKSILVLIIECNWGSLSVDDVYQVASYACSLISKNLQKGRFSPIHLEVWNENSWRYATFYPTGLVEINNNEVQEIKYSRASKTSLTTRLEERRNSSSKYSGFEYPNGEYVEGVLFISNERFTLPSAHLRGSFMSLDSKLFYQSKLRMIVGDQVLQWTSEDVTSSLEIRKEALKKEHAQLMDG